MIGNLIFQSECNDSDPPALTHKTHESVNIVNNVSQIWNRLEWLKSENLIYPMQFE